MNEYYRKRIITNFPGLLVDRIQPNENGKSTSNVLYNATQGVIKGSILLTREKTTKIPFLEDLFSIATGKIVEVEGKKYYEVYQPLFTARQSTLIANVIKMLGD